MDEKENIYYLKLFVKQHPDNRMAWYLLGKEYEGQGKEAKANYCYMQAGEIYEAFERRSHPLAAVERELEQLKQWNERKRARRFRRRTAMIAGLLLLLTASAPGALDTGETDSPVYKAVNEPDSGKEPGTVVLADLKAEDPLGSSWGKMVSLGGDYETVLAVQLEELGEWRLWLGDRKLLMSAQTGQDGALREVRLYDAETCDCIPAPAGDMEELLDAWSYEQETRWVLASAIQAYRRMTGQWPSSLEAMIRPYPDNVLSGERPGMREQFAPLLRHMQRTAEPVQADAAQAQSGSRNPVPGSDPSELDVRPLAVVVDKSTHRLAVVSGNIVVRSYEVGLGGDLTPEGEFVITEKVKNPNGTDKGPYGSRGLVLSGSQYAIHGTDEPDSIGLDESLGCVRMKRADLEELYDMVPPGTKVTIQKGSVPPDSAEPPENRFRLGRGQDETNPDRVYEWLQ
ncbi:L,D-transpeptidase [Paenibacillus thailandensis]|uniref:L,D-transpeptidase n=1 Tax=Paenibacillus thailandensis TaxID=393250 RepID=A0ABW5R1H0_9BACL